MMKKLYVIPQFVVEEFVPNEYVSNSCAYKAFICDVDYFKKLYEDKNNNGTYDAGDGQPVYTSGGNVHGCGSTCYIDNSVTVYNGVVTGSRYSSSGQRVYYCYAAATHTSTHWTIENGKWVQKTETYKDSPELHVSSTYNPSQVNRS